MNWLLALVIAMILKFIVADLFAGLPWLAKQIIRLAARLLPERDRERWEAEWIAESEAVPGRGFLAVLFALGVLVRAPATRAAVRPDAMRLRSIVIRRALDLAFVAAIFFTTLPLLILVALAVRISGGGSVLVKDARYDPGGEGKTFELLKFRTQALVVTGAVTQLQPTPVGKFLRWTSLDELPQLINVLKGDMTLAGRRPRRLSWGGWEESFPDEKPGMVSWSSVLGEQKGKQRDVQMARKWTLLDALRLLAYTIRSCFKSPPPR